MKCILSKEINILRDCFICQTNNVDNDVIIHGRCFAIDNREIFEQELEKYKSMRAISQRLYK